MKARNYKFLYVIFAFFFLIGCNDDEEVIVEAPTASGLETEYNLIANEVLKLKPVLGNTEEAVYEWWLDGQLVETSPTYTFKAPNADGVHSLLFKIENEGGITQKAITINVSIAKRLETNIQTILTLKAPQNLLDRKDFQWEVTEAPGELHRLLNSNADSTLFVAAQFGTYKIQVIAGELNYKYFVDVRKGMTVQTHYIAKVFDYMPAPGQFVNELPQCKKGDSQEYINAKVEEALAKENAFMITLGGWGGSVTFGFDHTIVNVAGKCDFRVKGNAFGAASNPNPNATYFGGSCEPAYIMVAYDKNKNGKPDEDEWYEIKGSGNFTAENTPWYEHALKNGNNVNTYRDYEMTYYKPESEIPEGGSEGPSGFATIEKYIRWTDNKGNTGYKIKNAWHKQSYYPLWVNKDQITYKGIRLADNGIDESGKGSYYVLYAYDYGYVDNYPNADDRSAIDIDWAIDKEGNKVELPGIDFVKVINGVDKENGWLGEASSEVAGAEDLHMLGKSIESKVVIK